MSTIMVRDTFVDLYGHTDTVRCAMATTLFISLVNSLTGYFGEEPKCLIESGHLHIDTDGLTPEAKRFVNSYSRMFVKIANDYPESFKLA